MTDLLKRGKWILPVLAPQESRARRGASDAVYEQLDAVMKDESAKARKSTVVATSRAWPIRLSGMIDMELTLHLVPDFRRNRIGYMPVSIMPGLIVKPKKN